MIEHLISTTHRLVGKILLSLRLWGTVAYTYTRMDHFWHYNINNAGRGATRAEKRGVLMIMVFKVCAVKGSLAEYLRFLSIHSPLGSKIRC